MGSNYASGVLQGVWGISVNNGPAGTTPVYTVANPVVHEYELCFKCHSAWAYGANPPQTPSGGPGGEPAMQTDPSVEFNPNNLAHHAVEAPGHNQPRNINPYFALTFVPPWGPESTVQCSDCHAGEPDEPRGPHGSRRRWLLRGNETGEGSAEVFCYNCHRRDVYGDADLINPRHRQYSRFSHPRVPLHTHTSGRWGINPWGIWCMNCHGGDSLGALHGTNRGVGQYGVTPLGKRFMNGVFVQGWTAPAGGQDGFCWAVCHPGAKRYQANYDYPP